MSDQDGKPLPEFMKTPQSCVAEIDRLSMQLSSPSVGKRADVVTIRAKYEDVLKASARPWRLIVAAFVLVILGMLAESFPLVRAFTAFIGFALMTRAGFIFMKAPEATLLVLVDWHAALKALELEAPQSQDELDTMLSEPAEQP